MASREVFDCDRCGAKDITKDCRLLICVGSSPCPAGGSSSMDYENVDLCPACMVAVFWILVLRGKVDGRELVKLARSAKS